MLTYAGYIIDYIYIFIFLAIRKQDWPHVVCSRESKCHKLLLLCIGVAHVFLDIEGGKNINSIIVDDF